MSKSGLYIHIPFCKRKCDYCAFASFTCLERTEEYIGALVKEIESFKGLNCEFDTLFFGGGTPSVLPKNGLLRIRNAVEKNLKTDFVEISAEANPESLTEEKIREYKDVGINRLSLGVQSLDDGALRTVNRLHDAKTALTALENACKTFDNVNADVILGLPGASENAVETTVKRLLQFPITHLSAYALGVEENTPLYRKVEEKSVVLPDEDKAADDYDVVKEKCAENGLFRYEVSNFAKVGKECRHNLKYWQRADYLGLGVSAHSLLGDERFYNSESLDEYLKDPTAKLEEGRLSNDEKKEEHIILGLRLESGFSVAEFNDRYNADFFSEYKTAIEKHADCFSCENGFFKVKPDKFYILNTLLLPFTN